MGDLRGGEVAWKSLYENVLQYNAPHIDLALMIGDPTPPDYRNASLFRWAKYRWSFHEYDDWADAVDQINNGSSWRQAVLPALSASPALLGGVGGSPSGGGGFIQMSFRYFLLQKIQELNLTRTYDRFVLTRTDHYYLCPHDLSKLDNRYLWVPVGEDYGGLCDRHLVVGAEHVLKALDLMPQFLQHYFDNYQDTTSLEQVLKRRLEVGKIFGLVRRFDRMMFTCAQPGDMTRWSKPSEMIPQGVHLKYRNEYVLSKKTCKRDRWSLKELFKVVVS